MEKLGYVDFTKLQQILNTIPKKDRKPIEEISLYAGEVYIDMADGYTYIYNLYTNHGKLI